jgi:phage terminase small subunit
MRKLTPKQARFVAEYLVDLNAKQAAIRAGYSAKTAEWIGPQLLQKTHVAQAIANGQHKKANRLQITADDWLKRIIDVADRARDGRIVDKDGNEFPDPKLMQVELKAGELVARHLGFFNDKVTVDGDAAAILALAAKRVKK